MSERQFYECDCGARYRNLDALYVNFPIPQPAAASSAPEQTEREVMPHTVPGNTGSNIDQPLSAFESAGASSATGQSSGEAWGIVENGKIDPRNVSNTRRAAIVNWLVTVKKLWVRIYDSDEAIKTKWQQHKGNAEAIPVTICAAYSAPDIVQGDTSEAGHTKGICNGMREAFPEDKTK